MTLSTNELDEIYTRLCKTMTELGEAQAPLFLARFALLAIGHIGEAGTALRLVEAAAEDLAPAAT